MRKSEINIRELNYSYFKDVVYLRGQDHNFMYCFMRFLVSVIASIVRFRFFYHKVNDIVFLTPTLNNQKTLKPIYEKMDKNRVSIISEYYRSFPQALIFIYSLIYFLTSFRFYLSCSLEEKRIVRYYFYTFFTTIGTYIVLEHFLKKNGNIKVIVFANDHIMQNSCMIKLCKKYGLKTIYTQHASVTEDFPNLKFDYSFLDGEESFLKYKKSGKIEGVVFLSGSPRFDMISQIKKRQKNTDAIGIALNILDSIQEAYSLCEFLLSKGYDHIIIRPHPGMLPIFNSEKKKFTDIGIEISDPTKEQSFPYLSGLKILIANESGIHLDAVLMGVKSVLYNLNSKNKILDWYSFVKSGLIPVANNFEEVIYYLSSEQLHINKEKARFFNSAYATNHEGKVGDLIAGFINSLIISEKNGKEYIDNVFVREDDCYVYKVCAHE